MHGCSSPWDAAEREDCYCASLGEGQRASSFLRLAAQHAQGCRRWDTDGLLADCAALCRWHKGAGQNNGGKWLPKGEKRGWAICHWLSHEKGEGHSQTADKKFDDRFWLKKFRKSHDPEVLLWTSSFGSRGKRARASLRFAVAGLRGYEVIQADHWQIQAYFLWWVGLRPWVWRKKEASSETKSRPQEKTGLRNFDSWLLRRGKGRSKQRFA